MNADELKALLQSLITDDDIIMDVLFYQIPNGDTKIIVVKHTVFSRSAMDRMTVLEFNSIDKAIVHFNKNPKVKMDFGSTVTSKNTELRLNF